MTTSPRNQPGSGSAARRSPAAPGPSPATSFSESFAYSSTSGSLGRRSWSGLSVARNVMRRRSSPAAAAAAASAPVAPAGAAALASNGEHAEAPTSPESDAEPKAAIDCNLERPGFNRQAA